MSQNYMNYFNSGASTGMSGVSGNNANNNTNASSGMGGDFGGNNQANFLGGNMSLSGGSFMDMINSAPPPMMNTPAQQPQQAQPQQQQMPRYNHPTAYNNMYGQSNFGGGGGMENSAMRLQQFANRQMTPRHGFDMGNQMNQEQMNQYYMQMRKMRMMQEYGSQARFNNPNMQQHSWPRNMMSNMPPHLQQMSSGQSRMMQNPNFPSEMNNPQTRMQNLSNQQYQQAGAFRKMPVLDEAPPSLRGPSPFSPQQAQQQQPQQQPSQANASFNPQFKAQNLNQQQQQQPGNTMNQLNANEMSNPLSTNENLNVQKMMQQQPGQLRSPLPQQNTQQKPQQQHPSTQPQIQQPLTPQIQQPVTPLQQPATPIQQPPTPQLQQPPTPQPQTPQPLTPQPLTPQPQQQAQPQQTQIPISQQQGANPISTFLNNFNTDPNSSLNVPQSPKLTHFGAPSSVSSASSFDQPPEAAATSPSSNLTQVTQTLAYASPPSISSQNAQPSPTVKPIPSPIVSSAQNIPPLQTQPMGNPSSNAAIYFKSLAQIQQQINILKQSPQTPEVGHQIQMLNHRYAMIFKQYEASKQQMPPFLEQMPNRPNRNAPPMVNQPQNLSSPRFRQQHPQQLQQMRQQGPLSPRLPQNQRLQSPLPQLSQTQMALRQQQQQFMQQRQQQFMQQSQQQTFSSPLSVQQTRMQGVLQQQPQPQQQPPPHQQPPQSNQLQQMRSPQPNFNQTPMQNQQIPPNSQPQHTSSQPQIQTPQQPKPQAQAKPSEISNAGLLEDSLDGINIPEFESFEKALTEDSKTDSLFSSAFLAGTDLFPSTSLFDGDPLESFTNKQDDLKKANENTITPVKQVENDSKSYQELSSSTTVLSSGNQGQQPAPNQNMQSMFGNNSFNLPITNQLNNKPVQQQAPAKQENFLPFPFNQNQFHAGPQIPPNIMMSMTNFMSQTISSMPSSSMNNINQIPGKPLSLPGMAPPAVDNTKQETMPKTKGKGKGSKAKAGGTKKKKDPTAPKGKAGRPPGSLNKKKREEKQKKIVEMEFDDFDALPPDELLGKEFDDPNMRRSLRERQKTTNYKDDFDYNISDDEGKKKAEQVEQEKEPKEQPEVKEDESLAPPVASNPVEPVIDGGVNQLVAYQPNLEVEGEIAIIEKILAMRTVQQEPGEEKTGKTEKTEDPENANKTEEKSEDISEEKVEESETKSKEQEETMVEEYYVKYKGYSYLHCEWGTLEYLAKKDKRVPAKIKRYKQKRDSSYAYLNELDDEPFNPDYVEIDRVLDHTTTVDPVTNDTIDHYLVKWRGLPYEDSTWELKMNIDESVIQNFHEMKKPPPVEQRRFKPRPQEGDWVKELQSPMYKNGNRLHDYQLEGMNWLTFCWYKRINCILADEMGLGKTIQSISLLCAMKKYGIRGPFLVIAPLSTIGNWQREFETWTDINAIVYHGSAVSRNNIQQYEMYYKDEKGNSINDVYKFEAIITTYEIVLSANQFLCTIPFRCLIIDEAHRLKNQKCKLMEGLNNLKMEHRVLLTGTPLQNNVEELFSLLNFLEPTRFPSQGAFMFEFGNLKTEGQVEKLKQILKPMMLRRVKADVQTNIASKEETIVEVELTTIQKKFYRAILERNFSFLAKGSGYSNLPNLMNTMMELRKCCNHPFLIKGAREKISSDYSDPEQPDKQLTHLSGLIESSGKMVLIDKLLPKLKSGGHKILVFSQMIKVLDLIQEYLMEKQYQFERIDGGVQGNMRQAAIDRFCRPDSDRFVFLLCTRAGGLGINLTAADTVIIFDSDWNPQNDLQAQARCHRIGQEKPVKVYRLICRNTYEREMFDRASLKLGLDKAVLGNMNQKETSGQKAMSKKEVEDLLKKGAYGAVMENDEDASNFCEEDIDQILQRRTQVIQIEGEGKGSTFSKASFVSDKAGLDVDIDDPDFWKKWAQKASIKLEDLEQDKQLIMAEPRKRKQTKRFGNIDGDALEMSDLDSDDEVYEPNKSKSKSSQYIERTAWTRVECFKVEKLLLIYGWDRWQDITSQVQFKQEVRNNDVEGISRTILAYCFRFYKTDEKSKDFFTNLIDESVKNAPPKNEKFDITDQILGSAPPPKNGRGRKRNATTNPGRNALRRLTHQYSKPALIECGLDWLTVDPDTLIIDSSYRKHLQQHCHKIMSRIRLIHSLKHDIIKEASVDIFEGKPHEEIEFTVPPAEGGELPAVWWDEKADKSLLIGTYKHGYEKYQQIRNDPCLYFYHKIGPYQMDEKAPETPESIVNPASVERCEDGASDTESVTSKKKSKPSSSATKAGENENDSMNESEDENDLFSSHNASPASVASNKETPPSTVPDAKQVQSNNPDTRWPQPNDLNMRLRRMFTSFLRFTDKEQLDILKAEKDKQKQVRLANMVQERQRKRAEMQQRWTRREESDFYKVLSNFGVIQNPETKEYDWQKFRQLAKLDKKLDETLTHYYEDFIAMCRRICGRATENDEKRLKGCQIEEISEDKASRCLQRVKLLNKIRTQVLPHEKLGERLALCIKSYDLPHWWKSVKHDKALLQGVAKHGLGRTEYQVLLDPDSIFKEMVDKIGTLKKESADDNKPTLHAQMNGEHPEKKPKDEAQLNNDIKTENKIPMHTNEYAQLLSSWPKDKGIVSHLEKVCTCVLKGEWPKMPKIEIQPMAAKLPSYSRPLISTVGHTTSAELTDEKHSRGNCTPNRDFKIKSIDGLKLTVKTDPKGDILKRKKRGDPIDFFPDDDRKVRIDSIKFIKKPRVERGVEMEDSRNVQIHIPSSPSTTKPSSPSSRLDKKPIIHFPSNVKVPKVSSIVTTGSTRSRSLTNTDHKPTIVKVLSGKPTRTRRHDSDAYSPVNKSAPLPSTASSDPTVGIHIDSPNSNVRIQGSKIEVKEKSSTKRDLSEVILKVPDPSRFMKSPQNSDSRKSRSTKVVKTSKPPPLTPDKHSPTTQSKVCEHKKDASKDKPVEEAPTLRRRPERSAKKRAKDSISEMSEAERPLGKDDLHERLMAPLSPSPRHSWRDMRSPPPHVLHRRGGDMYMDYYPDRSPPRGRSPEHLRRGHHSPGPFHRPGSPDRRSPPPIHHHHRPVSPPTRHRHTHSPPPPPVGRHPHNHSPHYREHEDHHKHFHYNEPLSPRFRGGAPHEPYFYPERSRSPYFYDYRHEKERLYEELERRSPPIKHRRLSPTRDLYSPAHKHDYIHIPTDSHSPRHLDRHSPHEGRFPYGRVDWDSPRFRHEGLHSPIRSSPVDAPVQYQPLSRSMPPRDEAKKPIIKSPRVHEEHRLRRSRSPVSFPDRQEKRRVQDEPTLKRSAETIPVANELSSPSKAKKSKPAEVERPVIEISTEAVRQNSQQQQQRKQPARKKGLGLLEMKIQGLKEKMEQSGVSDKIKEKMNSQPESTEKKEPSKAMETSPAPPITKPTKRLSDVISNLTQEKGMKEPVSKPPGKRSKSLADITKDLAKSVEQSSVLDSSLAVSFSKNKPTVNSVSFNKPSKPVTSSSKLSDVISTLKEKSKAASAQLPTSKFKGVPLTVKPSNDSKLLNILKSGNADKSPRALQKKDSPEETPTSPPPRRASVISSVICSTIKSPVEKNAEGHPPELQSVLKSPPLERIKSPLERPNSRSERIRSPPSDRLTSSRQTRRSSTADRPFSPSDRLLSPTSGILHSQYDQLPESRPKDRYPPRDASPSARDFLPYDTYRSFKSSSSERIVSPRDHPIERIVSPRDHSTERLFSPRSSRNSERITSPRGPSPLDLTPSPRSSRKPSLDVPARDPSPRSSGRQSSSISPREPVIHSPDNRPPHSLRLLSPSQSERLTSPPPLTRVTPPLEKLSSPRSKHSSPLIDRRPSPLESVISQNTSRMKSPTDRTSSPSSRAKSPIPREAPPLDRIKSPKNHPTPPAREFASPGHGITSPVLRMKSPRPMEGPPPLDRVVSPNSERLGSTPYEHANLSKDRIKSPVDRLSLSEPRSSPIADRVMSPRIKSASVISSTGSKTSERLLSPTNNRRTPNITSPPPFSRAENDIQSKHSPSNRGTPGDERLMGERFQSPISSPVYSPAVVSNPLTIDLEKKKISSGRESATLQVITPTRTPTPIKSPLTQTLQVVTSPRHENSMSPSFPASPPQLVDKAVLSSQLTRPTAIVATTTANNESVDHVTKTDGKASS